MTFSIAARDVTTGMVGVAISSSSICVAARCAYVRAGIGAALSQNVTDPTLGPGVLDALAQGLDTEAALEKITAGNPTIEYRQVLVQPLKGRAGARSGRNSLGVHNEAVAEDCIAAGNMLADAGVPGVMVDAFQDTTGHIAHRLVSAMEAGLAKGGEAGPVHSIGLLVASTEPWPIVNLRVDWTEGNPVTELRDLWTRYESQLDDYVLRAHRPVDAPSYGVAGDP